MASLTDYFNSIMYQPTYFLGDRVQGKWNGIPFVGTVMNDSRKYVDKDPEISVQVDLPIVYEGNIHNLKIGRAHV